MPPTGPNHVWAYDFVFDACADGKPLKCLTVEAGRAHTPEPRHDRHDTLA